MLPKRTSPPRALGALLLIAGSVPIALLAAPALTLALIVIVAVLAAVWLDPENLRRVPGRAEIAGAGDAESLTGPEREPRWTRRPRISGPFWASCLLVSGVTIAAVGLQLLCAASGPTDLGGCASSVCRVAFAHTRCTYSGVSRSQPDIGEINASVMAAMYHPDVSPAHPQGLVLLEARTTNGSRYLGSDTLAQLLRPAAPEAARNLAQAFRVANEREAQPERVHRLFPDQVLLDSMDVERYLATPVGPGVVVPVARPTTDAATSRLPQPVPLTGVLALSQPGVDPTGSLAVMFAVLRTPESEAPDKAVQARLFLLQRDGQYWRIRKAWPLRPRRQPSSSSR